jgi:restriction system protein
MSPRPASKSLIEEIAEQFEHLPWWAGLTAAAFAIAIGFLLPHVPSSGPLGAVIVVFGQWFLWILAAAVLLYTGVGVVRRWFSRRRFDRTMQVEALDPYEFEGYIEEFYRRRGYLLTPRGGRSADGGVDLVAEKRDERLIIQCKHWRVRSVGIRPVRELWGVVDHESATGAVLVTSGGFTPEAVAFARGKRLELIHGQALKRLVDEVRAGGQIGTHTLAEAPLPGRICTSCGSEMLLRVAKRGPNPGQSFWGCSRYPSCRVTAPA